MLGSAGEAEDAVQEAWLRLSRAEAGDIENLRRLADDGGRARLPGRAARAQGAARGARSRTTRRRRRARRLQPDAELRIADSVGVAMLVVLETLAPAERIAFVLHDLFDVPFDDIAPIVGRNAGRDAPARQPRPPSGAGRARRSPSADRARQRGVVDAFLAASRAGRLRCVAGHARSRRRAARRSDRGRGRRGAGRPGRAVAAARGLRRARRCSGLQRPRPGRAAGAGGWRAGRGVGAGRRSCGRPSRSRSWPAGSPVSRSSWTPRTCASGWSTMRRHERTAADRSLRDLPGRG